MDAASVSALTLVFEVASVDGVALGSPPETQLLSSVPSNVILRICKVLDGTL
jgi:hypothetical protein